jgi:hypothetical protein
MAIATSKVFVPDSLSDSLILLDLDKDLATSIVLEISSVNVLESLVTSPIE